VLASISADEDSPPPPLAPIMCQIPDSVVTHAAEMLAASAAPSAESTAGVVYQMALWVRWKFPKGTNVSYFHSVR
jgi:hypothetical protein